MLNRQNKDLAVGTVKKTEDVDSISIVTVRRFCHNLYNFKTLTSVPVTQVLEGFQKERKILKYISLEPRLAYMPSG